jgi:hypothetical protein
MRILPPILGENAPIGNVGGALPSECPPRMMLRYTVTLTSDDATVLSKRLNASRTVAVNW